MCTFSIMAACEGVVKVYVSTIPGLEFICVSECDEVFGVKSKKEARGRVSFSIAVKFLPRLCKLRSVHHYWLQVYQSSDYLKGDKSKEDTLQSLEELANSLKWNSSIYSLNYFKLNECRDKNDSGSKDGKIALLDAAADNSTDDTDPSNETVKHKIENDSLKRKGDEETKIEHKFSKIDHISPDILDDCAQLTYLNKKPSEIKFRVTCSRTGKHNFSSMEAAKYIGSGVKGHFGWGVDLENFDVEILAFIEDLEVTIAVKLSKESKHNRNVKFFGPTTLRATTSYCMLKLAGVKQGDIVCDPMCGTGSICLEGINSFPSSFHFGGELHSEGCQNARNNFDHLESERKSGLPCDALLWDVCKLPLRNGLVDAFVCDLPFGKRIGYKGRNFGLYPAVLQEIGRACRHKGKAVLLTQHKSAMNKALNSCSHIWKKQGTFFMNMGGLNAGIYVLKKIAC